MRSPARRPRTAGGVAARALPILLAVVSASLILLCATQAQSLDWEASAATVRFEPVPAASKAVQQPVLGRAAAAERAQPPKRDPPPARLEPTAASVAKPPRAEAPIHERPGCAEERYISPAEAAKLEPAATEDEVMALLKLRLEVAAEQNAEFRENPKQSRQLQGAALRTFKFDQARDLPENDEYTRWPHYVAEKHKKPWLPSRYAEHQDFCVDMSKSLAYSCDPKRPVKYHGKTDPAAYLTRGVMWDKGECPAAAHANRVKGFGWIVDISHGNSRSWSNICHWADTMYIAYTVLMHRDMASLPPLDVVAMYQVERDQFLAPRGIKTDWYSSTMRIVSETQTWGRGNFSLLFIEDFKGPVCFERAFTIGVDTRAPHFYSAGAADSYRAATVRTLRLSHELTYRLPAVNTLTLLLRTTDRKILNEDELLPQLRNFLHQLGWELQTKRLGGLQPFSDQVRLYASTSVLLSFHGAQLTNSPFMPRGSVLVEVFNCGHWSHSYRKFAEEAGVQYVEVRERVRGCQKDFGKLLGNSDRNLYMEELRPALCRAMGMVEENKGRLKDWALPSLGSTRNVGYKD